MRDASARGERSPEKKHALIVDDSPTACAVLSKMLRNYQITADSVYSADAALDYLSQVKPDVIFLDHAMPGMSGLDALKIIKARPEYATIPVMMYTARTGEVYLSEARALGAVDVLPKGVEQTVLEEALTHLHLLPKSSAPPAPTLNASGSSGPPRVDLAPTISDTILRVFRSELRPSLSHQIHDALDEWRNEALHSHRRQMELLSKQTKEQVELIIKPLEAELQWQFCELQRANAHARRRLIFSIFLFMFVFIGSLFWLSVYSDAQHERSQDFAAAQSREMTLALEHFSNEWTHKREEQNTSIDEEMDGPLLVLDEHGNKLGEFLGTNAANNEPLVRSQTGYLFSLNADGEIAATLPERYYLTPSCFGESYAKAHAGVLMRDDKNELWMTPLDAELQEIQAFSKLIGDECRAMNRGNIHARRVLPNDPSLTDVKNALRISKWSISTRTNGSRSVAANSPKT